MVNDVQESPKNRSRGTTTIVVVFVLLVLYPLSIGPVYRLMFLLDLWQTPAIAMAVGYFYLPLGLLINYFELLEQLVVWYIDFWMP